MSFQAAWRAPSNIALVKYWGKTGIQIPRNPSISFTLSTCYTEMKVIAEPTPGSYRIQTYYKGQPQPSFTPKIEAFFSRIASHLPWLKSSQISIDSHNTFPHGAGIASSASAMAALSLCLLDIQQQIQPCPDNKSALWWQHASELARLGSGSACRSLFPVAALWGQAEGVTGSDDQWAIGWEEKMSAVFKDFRDTILIISNKEKAVSSTAGHALMDSLPYADSRYNQARSNLKAILTEMEKDAVSDTFMALCESEAMQLHALMMCSQPPYMLIEPETLAAIQKIQSFRKQSGLPVCFTLDAGPNVHVLYPGYIEDQIIPWIEGELAPLCQNGLMIHDRTGQGPQSVTV